MDRNLKNESLKARPIRNWDVACAKATRDCLTGGCRSRYSLAHCMLKPAAVFFSVCASASWTLAAESIQLPLTREASRVISGASEFVFALPRHINVQAGSEITIVLRFRSAPPPTTDPLPVMINRHELQPRFAADPTPLALRIEASVPESFLQAGWNELIAVLPRQFGTCEVRRTESHLTLNFGRVPLFPELRRF